MTEDRTEAIDQRILNHLDRAELPDAVVHLLYAALLGEEELAEVLGGSAPPPRPAPAPLEHREPVGTYLESIEVTGFRGIGPTATLKLVPGPGLTIVTGRNGSGKSSFAEAAEFALTGDNKRWSGRARIWQEGWRNLHSDAEPRIRIRLGMDGQRAGAIVEHRWNKDAELTEGEAIFQRTGEPREPISALGWERPLELYRPFLSYSELSDLITGRPTEMHDSLQRILGLDRLVEVEARLKNARQHLEQQHRGAAECGTALRAVLADNPDPRARQVERALEEGAQADLDQLAALVTSDEAYDDTLVGRLRQLSVMQLPDREDIVTVVDRLRATQRTLAELAGTSVEEAQALAELLRGALRHQETHPDATCPVCGGRTLDQQWVTEAKTRLARATQQADQLTAARHAERAAREELRRLLPAAPQALTVDLSAEEIHTDAAWKAWRSWDELLAAADPTVVVEMGVDTFDKLVAALTPVRDAARAALERRQKAWQPVADRLRAWVDAERVRRQAAAVRTDLRKAITAFVKISAAIRADELRPIETQATEIWKQLRQDSNVQLDGVKLAGTGNARRVDLDVEVDGVPGAALGVMSQGELHALALALFLPRATVPASPFRFLIIDDPVQAMDPTKVHGLAQVLAEVAKERQVIVFTHDERLPAAVRHLGLNARVRIVSRLAHSQVFVGGGRDGDPAQRYLDDAAAIVRDEDMADPIRSTIVCSLIRDAIEYACQERVWVRSFRTGVPIAETEAAISEATGLRPSLALALLGDRKRVDDLRTELPKFGPAVPGLVKAVNSGAHGADTRALGNLIGDARHLTEKLMSRP